jgi:hypothetical protein
MWHIRGNPIRAELMVCCYNLVVSLLKDRLDISRASAEGALQVEKDERAMLLVELIEQLVCVWGILVVG